MPKIGTEFPVYNESNKSNSDSDVRYLQEKTKSVLALIVLAVGIIAMAIALIYSMITDDYTALTITSLTASPIIGLILASYFRERPSSG